MPGKETINALLIADNLFPGKIKGELKLMDDFGIVGCLVREKNRQIEEVFNDLLISDEHTEEIAEAIQKIADLENEYAFLIKAAQEREEAKRRNQIFGTILSRRETDAAPYSIA